jgi:hypothetical protein
MGYSSQPDYQILSQLYTGLEGTSPNRDAAGILNSSTIQNFLTSTFSSITNANVFADFLGQFSVDNPIPSDIGSFTSALIAYLNSNGGSGGSGPGLSPPLDTSTVGAPFTEIENGLSNIVGAALMNASPNPDGAVMSAVASSSVLNQIDQQAFNQFLAGFQYTGNTQEGTALSANGSINSQYFADRFNECFFQLASVGNTTNLLGQPGNTPTSQPLLNFQDIYSTYFGGNTSAFESFLGNYINQQITANGSSQSFVPSQDIGTWLNEVQQAYSIALSGSGSPLTSSVGQTTSKVDILEQVFQLLVQMIGVLQNVAEAQSAQLQELSSWEGAYTDLQAEVPTFTAGDGSIFGGTYGNNSNTTNVATTSKDDANSLNQTYIQTIQSRRTQVDNTAQAMQNDLNQSNDTANQQSDGATTIIQNLTTILNNLYSKS